MSSKIVRHSKYTDIEAIMTIYHFARNKMVKSGNPSQWIGGYPSQELIQSDIASGNSYVVTVDDKIIGVFSFIIGEDDTYSVIDGEWLNDKRYGTIHRIASADGVHGIADTCLEFCKTKGVDIRIDTHADNTPMLSWIRKRGFVHCGTIYVANGTPRLAFQLANGL